jgi:hypothetical protein
MVVKVYKIERASLSKLKAVLEAQEKDGFINEFARHGYKLWDAKTLELGGDASYLYINAENDFFSRNEGKLKITGVQALSGKDLEKVKKKIEDAEESAEAGLGAIFG